MRHRQSLEAAITDLHVRPDRECCWGLIWEAADPTRVPPISTAITTTERWRNLPPVSPNREPSSFWSPSGLFLPAEETRGQKTSETRRPRRLEVRDLGLYPAAFGPRSCCSFRSKPLTARSVPAPEVAIINVLASLNVGIDPRYKYLIRRERRPVVLH